jgi:hypothetical protein
LNPVHRFNSSINSRLPLGVFLTTVITSQSGDFYNITTGFDDNGDGTFNDRPPGVGRYAATGPGRWDVGFNVTKAFRLRPSGGNGGPQLSVFANLNNAFNTTHLGTPEGVLTSPFFGKSTSADSPREIEAGMRFQF